MKIIINKCKDPKNCIKCVKICPLKVFVIKPIGTKRLSSYVKRWEIKPLFKDLCTGCMECTRVCTEKCIIIQS